MHWILGPLLLMVSARRSCQSLKPLSSACYEARPPEPPAPPPERRTPQTEPPALRGAFFDGFSLILSPPPSTPTTMACVRAIVSHNVNGAV